MRHQHEVFHGRRARLEGHAVRHGEHALPHSSGNGEGDGALRQRGAGWKREQHLNGYLEARAPLHFGNKPHMPRRGRHHRPAHAQGRGKPRREPSSRTGGMRMPRSGRREALASLAADALHPRSHVPPSPRSPPRTRASATVPGRRPATHRPPSTASHRPGTPRPRNSGLRPPARKPRWHCNPPGCARPPRTAPRCESPDTGHPPAWRHNPPRHAEPRPEKRRHTRGRGTPCPPARRLHHTAARPAPARTPARGCPGTPPPLRNAMRGTSAPAERRRGEEARQHAHRAAWEHRAGHGSPARLPPAWRNGAPHGKGPGPSRAVWRGTGRPGPSREELNPAGTAPSVLREAAARGPPG